MSEHLKTAIEQLGGRARLPRPVERCAVERAAERLKGLENGRKRQAEPWETFIARFDLSAPSTLQVKALKRVIDEVWLHESSGPLCAASVRDGLDRARKSVDRNIVYAYLRRFPRDHEGFLALAAGSDVAASRHDWPWKDRGQKWQLWKPDQAPALIARALLASDDPSALLRETGLDEFADGGLMTEALLAACAHAAEQRGAEAGSAGQRLIALFERLQQRSGLHGPLAYALLRPWVDGGCPEVHKRAIMALLVARMGDPRLQRSSWDAHQQDVEMRLSAQDCGRAFDLIRRWLVDRIVRAFFNVVAKTTSRPDQWSERTEFWLGYLDSGYISDACFAFGSDAERLAKSFLADEKLPFARIQGQGSDASSSVLLMTIGDLRIAEWSSNGSARFWDARTRRAPPMDQPVYYALVLRSMDGPVEYEPMPHTPVNRWQPKFAKRIYRHTGIQHPKHGAGW